MKRRFYAIEPHKIFWSIVIPGLLLIASACLFDAHGQIVQFSGAPVSGAAQYLEQQFPGTTVLLSTTKENSSYSGDCMEIRRASDSTTTTLNWTGKECATSTFDSFCAATTCFLRTWYDQRASSPNDCIQTTNSRQLRVLKTNSKIEIRSTTGAQGCEIADSASYKATQPNVFVVLNQDSTGGGNPSQFIAGYTPTGDPNTNSRWGIGWIYSQQGGDGHQLAELQLARNAVPFSGGTPGVRSGAGYSRQNTAEYVVWDFSPNTYEMRIGETGVAVKSPETGANVTYGASSLLMLGNGRGYDHAYLGGLRMFVMYGSIQASRNAISAFISSSASQNLQVFPWTITDSDGFIFTMDYKPAYSQAAPDGNGYEWGSENQGYNWSFGTATNVNNGKVFVQYGVHAGDFDALANGEQRAERGLEKINGVDPAITKGTTQYWRAFQYKVLTGPAYTQGWCMIGQVHTNSGGSADLFYHSLWNDNITITSQRGGADTDRNVPYAYSREIWRAVVYKFVWSVSGSADTFEAWEGPNGGTLTKRVNLTTPQAIFPTDTAGAYWKNGIYTGAQGQNVGNFITVQIANDEIATGVDALLARVTTQTTLPTH